MNEITNEDIMKELAYLHKQVDHIREMIYETNADFYDTWQITCFDRECNFKPLTNRELLLYMMDRYPMQDETTWREKLLTKEELHEQYGVPMELIKHGFEEKQGKYRDDIDWDSVENNDVNKDAKSIFDDIDWLGESNN